MTTMAAPRASAPLFSPSAESMVKAAFDRGYSDSRDFVFIVVGLVPAAVMTVNRAPGYESAALLVALFWACPIALLLGWMRLDRAEQTSREIYMWFEAVVMSVRRRGADPAAINALERAAAQWEQRPLVETARALRTDLTPIVRGRLPNGFWIFEARFFWVLFWSVISIGVCLIVTAAALWLPAECAGCN